MGDFSIREVKSRVEFHGRILPMNALYGRFTHLNVRFDFLIDTYDLELLTKGILKLKIWNAHENRWTWGCKCPENDYQLSRIYFHALRNAENGVKCTPYISARELKGLGLCPKEKKPQNTLDYRIPNIGYAISSRVITDSDPMRKVRAGVKYLPYG